MKAGTNYTVAVYVAGSGGSYRYGITPLPQRYGDITIQGTTYAAYKARPINSLTTYMYGQVDIEFVPGTSS